MSDTDDRRNLEDTPDTDGENTNDDNQNGDGDESADDSVATSGSAPDPGESGRMDTTRLRSTI